MARILFLCDTFLPNIGGSEAILLECARGVSASGHRVVVMAPQGTKDKATRNAFDQGEPYSIHRSRVWEALFQAGGSRHKLINRLARACIGPWIWLMAILGGGFGSDVIIAGHAVPAGNVALWLRCWGRGAVIVMTYGEEVTVYSRGMRLRGWLRSALRGADVITCLTSYSAKEIVDLEPRVRRSPMVCPPPANETILQLPSIEGQRECSRHGLENKTIVLTAARLVPRKGIDVTLRGLALIATDFPDLVYLIAGDGAMRGELELLVQDLGLGDRVMFLGEIANMAPLYHACDLFVMPNRQMPDGEREGYGIVFAEAGFAGKPVIGGRSGGAVDAIEDGVTGLLVDPTDPAAVADAMRQLLHDPARAKAMGEAGRERALRISSSEAYRARFNEVLKVAGIRA